MSLDEYFANLIKRVEESDIGNNGTDKNGFFEPTREVLLQKLGMLRDLHDKSNPHAKAMMKSAWGYVVEKLPAEWLVLNDMQKGELKKILS